MHARTIPSSHAVPPPAGNNVMTQCRVALSRVSGVRSHASRHDPCTAQQLASPLSRLSSLALRTIANSVNSEQVSIVTMGDKQAYQEYEPCVWSADTLPRVQARARIEIHAPSLIGPGTISVLGWDGSEKLRAGQSAVNLACSKYVRFSAR